jgi:hypothetical protein
MARQQSIAPVLDDAANFKRRTYAAKAKELLSTPEQRATVTQKDPLHVFDLELIPAVVTPLGNISKPLDTFLFRLARAVAEREKAERGRIDSDWTVYDRLRQRAAHSRFRKILAVAIAKGVAASFSAAPQRVNT